ncbi:MAG: hypothetical protein PHU31_05520 [Anaerotignum sp.]|nr:hypothetical protein [Anaerotignum sp.]
MYNRRYDKVFLMLRQETAGYNMGQRAPWGSCIMEIKNGTGRISLTVQGLRPINRGRYAVYAIAGEKETQNNFFCGVLTPDSAGHGELKWDFNPDYLGDMEVTAEALHTVAVLAEADGGFSAPMTAYFGSKVDWRTYFKIADKKKETQPGMPKIKEVQAEKPKTKETQVEIPKIKESPKEAPLMVAESMAAGMPSFELPSFELPKIKLKNDAPKGEIAKPKAERKESYQGSFRGLLEKFRQELEELQDAGVFTEKEMARIERAGRRNLQNEMEQGPVNVAAATEEAQTNNVEKIKPEIMEKAVFVEKESRNAQRDAYLEKYKLLKENTDIFPFGNESVPWKCISIEEMVLLEDIPLAWLKDYFIILSMKKYHHLIWKPQAKGYLLGVPGADTARERAKAEQLGFSKFQKMEDGTLGYWIFTKK